MWKHVGSCRFIWNYMLALQEEKHNNGENHLSAFSMIKQLTPLKKQSEYFWLTEVSNTSLQIVCQDLGKAYDEFFKKSRKHPKFKSRKKAKAGFPICAEKMYFTEEKTVQIQKLGKVKFKTNYTLPTGKGNKFINPRVSNINGKWILTFGMECENQTFQLTDKNMGIDLGIKDLAIVAYGEEQIVFHNINKSQRVRKLKRTIKHLQRSISRKYEEARKRCGKYVKSNNIEKLEAKLRKLYTRLANIRNNYLHQVTHSLVSKLPRKVIMEDLNVSGMMKNKHLSKAIAEQCFYEFIRQMKYKCEWRGIEFIQVDRFYPSSKTCSCCGAIKHDLRLRDRVYICNKCGLAIDRDYNAAINLMRYVA